MFVKDERIRRSVYTTLVRPRMEYASSVWHWGLSSSQRKKLERQQKYFCKMLRIDNECLTLEDRRTKSCVKKYNTLEKQKHVLSKFICKRLPRTNKFRLKIVKTERCRRSFFYKTPVEINDN